MSRRRPLVPGSEGTLKQIKAEVMRQQGYHVDRNRPNDVKYEVAAKLGTPLEPGYNGNMSTESAGKIGGAIGGSMVKEMIRMAQQQMSDKQK
jgi:small acid-soluble spore protein D (minor alpha/beta-type SASP)